VASSRRQKDLLLILAREFASKLATPMAVFEADGTLVYFNEPAEAVLGRRFAEASDVSPEEWPSRYQMEDLDGSPLAFGTTPASVALVERRPAHRTFRLTGLDGVRRVVSVTAFPLSASSETLVGVVVIFWAEPGAAD
jgi:PAS domain-containing protein